jgi:hypothetical protein
VIFPNFWDSDHVLRTNSKFLFGPSILWGQSGRDFSEFLGFGSRPADELQIPFWSQHPLGTIWSRFFGKFPQIHNFRNPSKLWTYACANRRPSIRAPNNLYIKVVAVKKLSHNNSRSRLIGPKTQPFLLRNKEEQIIGTQDKPQWIVAQRLLSHLQYLDATKSSTKDLSSPPFNLRSSWQYSLSKVTNR